MKIFATKTCPLCGKGLFQKFEYPDRYSFKCSKQAELKYTYEWVGGDGYIYSNEDTLQSNHYEVYYRAKNTGYEASQITIVPPFKMITESGTNRTRILEWKGGKLIMEIPLLLPDRSEDKLLQKLKTYVLFS